MTALKRLACGLAASLALLSPAAAQLSMQGARITLGGGYLEQPETGYFVGQLGTSVYEDARFTHSLFAEVLIHGDDSKLDFLGPGGAVLFTEDADIVFTNITGNYELEVKVAGPVSLFAGGGAGVEVISINDRFEESLDEDYNFVAQVFAGVRVILGESFQASAGVRRVFREDFELLNDQFITEDSWGFDFSLGLRF